MIGSKTWSAALLLLAVFGAGAAVGAVGMKQFGHADAPHASGPTAYLDRLQRELDLNPGQRAQIQGVLERYRPQMEALWAEQQPRYEALREGIRAEIRPMLTDAQRTKYEEMIRRHDAERSARARRGRP